MGWVITIIHIVIFFISRHFLTKKKKALEIDLANERIKNDQLTGQLNGLKRIMSSRGN